MAQGQNTSVYFREAATLERIQTLSEKSGVSTSRIIDAVVTSLLDELERQLPTKRVVQVRNLDITV